MPAMSKETCTGRPTSHRGRRTASIRWSGLPIFGVVNGGWSDAFAARVPLGSEVILATHHDEAGERYAEHVAKTVKSRAVVMRSAAA